jgi:hypothetical protein
LEIIFDGSSSCGAAIESARAAIERSDDRKDGLRVMIVGTDVVDPGYDEHRGTDWVAAAIRRPVLAPIFIVTGRLSGRPFYSN